MRGALRRDLRGMIAPRDLVRLVRNRPRLLLVFAGCLLVTCGLTAAVMAAFGKLQPIGYWVLFPGLVAAGLFGALLDHERRKNPRRT